MSYEKQPDPVLPNYNPSSWDSPLSAEEQEVLDAYYVKFPIAQNAPITFPGGVTVANGVKSTSLASTEALDISLGAPSVLNVGVITRTGANAIHHYSDGNNSSGAVHLNNGTTNNSKTNIHNGTGANPNGEVNIMTGTSNSGTINIGGIETRTNMTGSIIKQVVPLQGGGILTNIIGDADNATSMSTTFSRKSISTLSPIACFKIIANIENFACGYFELTIIGSNQQYGGYAYKGFFGIKNNNPPSSTVVTPVTTVFSLNNAPSVTFTGEGTTELTLSINTRAGGSPLEKQTFIATLVSYPSITIDNALLDYAVTAI